MLDFSKFDKFAAEFRGVLVKETIANTRAWADRNKLVGTKPEEPKLSKKAEAIKALLPGFGCNADYVAQVMSILLDEKIESTKARSGGRGLDFTKTTLVALVPDTSRGNPYGHNYFHGEVAVMYNGQSGVRANGSYGNSITPYENELRVATDKEIKDFYAKLPDEGILKLIEGARTAR